MSQVDWLSHLLQSSPLPASLRTAAPTARHGVLTVQELGGGDIVLLPHGSAHVLHDASGKTPINTHESRGSAGWMLSENNGRGEQLDLLCGRFFVATL